MLRRFLTVVALLASATYAVAQAPKVTHIWPDAGIDEQSMTAHIYGGNLAVALPSVKLIRTGCPDIDGTSIDLLSQEYLTCSFDLTDDSTGLYDLVVTSTFGEDTLPGCFTVYSASIDTPYIWFKTTVGSGGGGGVAVGDGDGDSEIEVYGADGFNNIYQFKWDGTSWVKTTVGSGSLGGVAIGDGNGDGKIEVYGARDTIYQFKWDGSSWVKTTVGSGGFDMRAVAVGDGNGDGELEVYGANRDCNLYQFKWDGSSWAKTTVGPGGLCYAVAVGDGNRDDEIEVYGGLGSIYQFKWDGTGWVTTTVGSGGTNVNGVAVGDGNGDGEMGVYGGWWLSNNLHQFKWDGMGWVRTTVGSGGGDMNRVAVGDGNGDSQVEVYGANADGNLYQFKPAFLPDILLSDSTYDFGIVHLGDSLDWDWLAIKNVGVDTLIVDSLVSDTTDYIVVSPSFPDTILASDSTLVTVRFKPLTEGIIPGTLWVYSNDPDEGTLYVTLTGLGYTEADIELSDTIHDFGLVLLGDSLDWDWLAIRNTGNADLYVNDVTSDTAAYIVVSPPFPDTIVPDDSTLVTVRFKPLSEGVVTGQLTIYSNDPDESPTYVALAGQGYLQEPYVTLSDTFHDFGGVPVGDSLDWQWLVIGNAGFDTLYVDSLISDTAAYLVVSPSFPDTVVPDDSTLVTVKFRPPVDDTIAGTLSVHSNDPYRPVVDVLLIGVGLDIIPPSPFSLISPPDSAMLAIARPTFFWERSSDTLSGLRDYEIYIRDTLRRTSLDTSWTADYDLPEGWHNWHIVAYDSAGNLRQSNEIWSVLIDTTSPNPPVLHAPIGGVWQDSLNTWFSWGEVFAKSGKSAPARYIIEADTVLSFSSPVIHDTTQDTSYVASLFESRFYWRAMAYDLAGNPGLWAEPDSFGVDTTAPVVPSLVSPDSGAFLNAFTPTLIWHQSFDNLSGLMNYTLQYALDDAFSVGLVETTTVDTSLSLTLADTTYYWRVKATDRGTNESEWSSTWFFEIDSQAPDVPVLISPDNSSIISNSTPTYVWGKVVKREGGGEKLRASLCPELRPRGSPRQELESQYLTHTGLRMIDGAAKASPVTYSLQLAGDAAFTDPVIDTAGLVDTTYTPSGPLPDSLYFWHVEAVDGAGNHSGFSPTWMFIVDTEPPHISGTTIWPDTSFMGPFPVSSMIFDQWGISLTLLWYRTSVDTIWRPDTMQITGPDEYTGQIPSQSPNTTVYYYIQAEDNASPPNQSRDPETAPDSSYHFIAGLTGIAEMLPKPSPEVFKLHQPRPNPVFGVASILYQLPEECAVSLQIYDVSGALVKTLVDGVSKPGFHKLLWDGRDMLGKRVGRGVYFILLKAGSFAETRKALVLR